MEKRNPGGCGADTGTLGYRSAGLVHPDSGEIVRRVVTKAKENGIILLHDCYETSVEAALQIIDLLKEKGYEFVTVDELIME